MKDYIVANAGHPGDVSGIEQRILDAYQSLLDAEESIENVENILVDLSNESFDVCNALSFVDRLTEISNSVVDTLSSMINGITSAFSIGLQEDGETESGIADGEILEGGNVEDASIGNVEPTIAPGLEEYCATGILMKKYTMLKYKIEKIKLVIERKVLEVTKSVLIWTLDGRGSMMTVPIQAPLAATATAASLADSILSKVEMILTLIGSINMISVDGAGTAFFATPKSLTKTGIKIMNSNQSTTNNLPDAIRKLMTEVEESIKKSNGELKKSYIAAAAAEGAASAASGNFEYSGIGNLEVFDPQKVKDLVNAILTTVVDADALPRYEKLSILNPRFMVYLATGLEPAAKKSFGIPGFP